MRMFVLLPVCILLLLSACTTTTLKSIKENPKAYVGKELTIKATVKNDYAPALSPVKIYELDDGSDTLYMASVKKESYKKDSEIKVRGEIFYLGGDNLTDGLEDFKQGIKKMIVESGLLKEPEADVPAVIVIEALKMIVRDKTFFLILIDKAH